MTADPRTAWVTAEVLAEAEDEFTAELAERLTAGGSGTGLTLQANECRVLAELIANCRPKRNRVVGRPKSDGLRELSMLLDCIDRKRNGASTEAAVAATAKEFSVSRSTVFAALKSK